MKIVTITTGINYCTPQTCGATITVGELIAKLQNFNEDTPVLVQNIYAGAPWGTIQADDIEEDFTEEYED